MVNRQLVSMKFLGHICLFLISLAFSYFTCVLAGELYAQIFGGDGTWTDVRGIVGLPLSYIFFVTLLFSAFGGKYKYLWIFILLIPVVLLEAYIDLFHLYLPVIIVIVALLLAKIIVWILKWLSGGTQ